MTNIKTCFLVDDDLDDQEIFAMALQQVDDRIALRSARDGADALNKLKENHAFIPDYIFLDINMPKMNGLQCLPEIRKLSHLTQVKVIMYSTTSDENMQNASKQLGADEFLVKPAKLGLLVNHLHRIFEITPI